MQPKTEAMKSVLFLLLLWLVPKAWGQTNLLTGNLQTFGQAGRTNVTMSLTLISPKNRTLSTNFISNDDLQSVSDMLGNFGFTNVAAGVYSMSAGDSLGTRWRIPVYTNTLGLVALATLANAGGTPPNPATNYVSQAQLTASLAGLTGGGGSSTNLTWNTSTNQLGELPLKIRYVFTNGIPWYGVFLTNN